VNFCHHRQCNSALVPAEGTEDNVLTLPVQRGTLRGVEVVRSFWQPSPDELKVLNQGGYVALTVHGSTHPPLNLGVSD
jgi:hypothetical protein